MLIMTFFFIAMFIAVSFMTFTMIRNSGVPYHGEGHEGHGDEHGDEEEGHDEHEGERIFSNTESDKVNIRGQVGKVDFFFQDSDYSHTEQHAEEDHGDEHGDEDGDHDDHGHGHDHDRHDLRLHRHARHHDLPLHAAQYVNNRNLERKSLPFQPVL